MIAKAFGVLTAGLVLIGAADAQPLTGGLPDVAARVTTLETTVGALKGQLGALQGQLGALQSTVTTLQTQVTVLQNSNSGLQSALDAEIAARKTADSTLKSDMELAFALESAQRNAADQSLQQQIAASSKGFSSYTAKSGLVHGETAIVGSLGPLPAGNYSIVANATVVNSLHNAVWSCYLERSDNPNIAIGRAATGTVSQDFLDSVEGVFLNNITIPVLVTIPANTSIQMLCWTGINGSDVENIQIVATAVGTATIGCSAVDFCP